MSPYNRAASPAPATSYPALDKAWVTKGITTAGIEFAEKFGLALATGTDKDKLTTSQIRNFFGEVRRIQMKPLAESHTDLLLLSPKLAYAAARSGGAGPQAFQREMQKALVAVNPDEPTGREQRFQNFCDLLEAILAYHKVGGGK